MGRVQQVLQDCLPVLILKLMFPAWCLSCRSQLFNSVHCRFLLRHGIR